MPSSGYRKQTMDFGEMSRDLQSAAASFTKMSAAAAGFVSLVSAFKTFELEVTRANSAIGGTAKTYKQLSDAARNFALVSKYSAGEAAGSMVMLAQAGFDAQETMSAMPHVLQLAQASMENLDLVADTVASTIRTFNMSADEAARVTNVFAASCVNSLATVNKLAFSFRQVGPVAAEMGMNIEETAAALDVLYNRGLRGEQAGTALRNILVRLIKPTQDTLNAFSLLGIGLKNADGSARDLQAILSDLKRANLDDSYLAKIFGREALAASKTLIAATTGEYERMKDSITDTNTVARMANAQMNTLDGALKLIKNSLNEVGIILGQSVGPVVKQVGSIVQDFAIYLRSADSSTISLIKNFGSFVALLGSAKFGITKLLGELGKLVSVGDKLYSTATVLKRGIFYGLGGKEDTSGYAEILRLKEISNQYHLRADAYEAMNEEFKRMSGGAELSKKVAMQIRTMTAAQVANTKAALAGAAAWNTLTKAFWGSLAAIGKLALALAPLYIAFKAWDSFMQERERKQQAMSEAFPELEYLDQKIKELKVTTANDLPAIVQKYKEAMDSMRTTQEVSRRINLQGLSLVDGKVVQDPELERGIKAIKDATLKQIQETGTINEHDLRVLAKNFNVSVDLLEAYLSGVKERLKDTRDTIIGAGEYAFVVSRAEDSVTQGAKALTKMIEASSDALKKNEELNKSFNELTEKYATQMVSDLLDAGSKLNWLVGGSTDNALNDKVKQYFIQYITGMSYADMGIALQENRDKIKELLAKHNNDLSAVRKEFIENFLRELLSPEELSSMGATAQADVEVTVTPTDLTQQNSAVMSLRKKVADMVADYKLSWNLLTEQQQAQIKLGKIQSQQDANRQTALATQSSLVQKLYDKVKTEEFSWKSIEPTLKNIDATTGAWLDKERFLAILNQNKNKDVREYGAMLLDNLELVSREEAQQQKLLEKEKERLTIVEGRYKYEQEHQRWLSEQIAVLDKGATTDFFDSNNLSSGIQAGLYTVAQEVDSTYTMMKNGAKGFADYMSDSMYDIVENWGKGWSSMRDALRNTLTDMLKELSQYFIKQSMYRIFESASGLFGSTGATSTATGAANTAANTTALAANTTALAANTTALATLTTAIGFSGATGGASDGGNVISAFVKGLFNGSQTSTNALGGIWHNGLQTFANGGIVGSPTLFNTRSGKGLMGEAGPEAIMPLRRDSQGRLGVSASTGSTLNYAPSFNINVTTGELESTESQKNTNRMTKELDNKVKSAVLLVLAKEKRPGGLLYGGAR